MPTRVRPVLLLSLVVAALVGTASGGARSRVSYVAVDGRSTHRRASCALTIAAGVVCWGGDGYLGAGKPYRRLRSSARPVPVAAPSS